MHKVKLIMVALAVGAAVIAWQDWKMSRLQNEVKTLTSNNVKLSFALNEQSAATKALQENIQQAIDSSNRLAEELGIVETHRRRITAELNSYRGRLNNVAIKKPTLIERRARTAFDGLVREASSIGN